MHIRDMMNRSFFLLGFSCIALWSSAQFDTSFAKTNVKKCVDSLIYGFKAKEWGVFTRYTNPAMIGTLGGKSSFIEYMSKAFMQIPDSAWKKYESGDVLQVVKTNTDLQSIVELKIVLDYMGTKITSTAHLVGQSWDGGMFWTFFDSQNDRRNALVIKPDLSEELIIPKKNEKMEGLPPGLPPPPPPPPPAKKTTTKAKAKPKTKRKY
jgi:hypothetical protein